MYVVFLLLSTEASSQAAHNMPILAPCNEQEIHVQEINNFGLSECNRVTECHNICFGAQERNKNSEKACVLPISTLHRNKPVCTLHRTVIPANLTQV